MTVDEQPAEERNESEPDDKLTDLEPTEDDADALKGGGPKNQTIQTGGGPEE